LPFCSRFAITASLASEFVRARRACISRIPSHLGTDRLAIPGSLPLAGGLAAALDVVLEHKLDVRRQRTTISSGELVKSPFEARAKPQSHRLGLLFNRAWHVC
jgi:hypothetical protein